MGHDGCGGRNYELLTQLRKMGSIQLTAPQIYTLQLGPRATYEVVLNGAERKGFSKPATVKCPKLYVVTRQQEIHYVGVANRQMSARINHGLKAKGKGGYHGYKWKDIRDPLKLFVWSFPDKSWKFFFREIETVEAEFTFLVRKQTGRWPINQTEIHFWQPTPAHLNAAEVMLALCSE